MSHRRFDAPEIDGLPFCILCSCTVDGVGFGSLCSKYDQITRESVTNFLNEDLFVEDA